MLVIFIDGEPKMEMVPVRDIKKIMNRLFFGGKNLNYNKI